MRPKQSTTRRVHTTVNNVIDEDGVLLSQNEVGIDITVKGQEKFFMVLEQHFKAFLHLEGTEMKVLMWCSMNSNLDTNEIVLSKPMKERMSDHSGISVRSIDNALVRLTQKKMLVRLGRSHYHLNPQTTWRGHIDQKAKNVRVWINYHLEEEKPEFPESNFATEEPRIPYLKAV